MILTYYTPQGGEFDYEVYPTKKDYAEYYFWQHVSTPIGMSVKESSAFRRGAIAALREAFFEDYALCDEMSEDEGFREFIKNKYEDKAFESVVDY